MLDSLKPSDGASRADPQGWSACPQQRGGVACGPSGLVCMPPAERAPGCPWQPYHGCHSMPHKRAIIPFCSMRRDEGSEKSSSQSHNKLAPKPKPPFSLGGHRAQPGSLWPSGRSAAGRQRTHRGPAVTGSANLGGLGLSRLHYGRRGGPRAHLDARGGGLETWSRTSALSSGLQAREVSEQLPPGQPPGNVFLGRGRPQEMGGAQGAEARAGISSRPQGDFPSLHAAPHPPERQRQAPCPLTCRHTALPSVPGATLQHVPSTRTASRYRRVLAIGVEAACVLKGGS